MIKGNKILTWPVSVSNLYNRRAGLLDPMFDFLGVTDGDIIIQLTGFPIYMFYPKHHHDHRCRLHKCFVNRKTKKENYNQPHFLLNSQGIIVQLGLKK